MELEKKKRKISLNFNTYVILFSIIVISAIATWFVPAGEYDRVLNEATGRMVIDPNSFHYIDSSPVGFLDGFGMFLTGLSNMAEMIFFVFIIGGAFGVIRATGALDAALNTVIHKMEGREKLAIPVIMLVFSLFGTIMGCMEEMLPFFPLIIIMMVSLGYDRIVGLSCCLVGTGIGFAGATINPFTVGVGQGILELPPYSGMGFRVICYVVYITIAIIYVSRYAAKIRKDPEKSLLYGMEHNASQEGALDASIVEFTKGHKLVLLTFALGLVALVVGIVKFGFYLTEMSAIFIIVALLAGFFAKMKPGELADEFIKGMSGLAIAAMMMGMAGAISATLTAGGIMDTVIHALATVVQGLPAMICAPAMVIVQTCINLFIGSGSGQAAAVMPIMGPLADVIGVTRQTTLLAFLAGDGFTNLIWPTGGTMMAGIAIAGIPYAKWVKYILKLILLESVAAMILVTVSYQIGYGPF